MTDSERVINPSLATLTLEVCKEDLSARDTTITQPVAITIVFNWPGEQRRKVDPKTLFIQAQKRGNMCGIAVANALIRQQELIPAEWQNCVSFVFPGAIRIGCDGNDDMAVVRWENGSWRLGWEWFRNRPFTDQYGRVHTSLGDPEWDQRYQTVYYL